MLILHDARLIMLSVFVLLAMSLDTDGSYLATDRRTSAPAPLNAYLGTCHPGLGVSVTVCATLL